jgi:hypothetical protein
MIVGYMKKQIHVAGDVCLDVLGISMPPPVLKSGQTHNWRQTGETRTHFRLGGALLLAEFIKVAVEEADVHGPRPRLPDALAQGRSNDQPLSSAEFLDVAERLTRKEVVHSLIQLSHFPTKPGDKDADTLRIQRTHGFSGPSDNGEPSLEILPPDAGTELVDVLVLDDTGNRFRRTPAQWPTMIKEPKPGHEPLIVHKLHRPLPTKSSDADESSSSTGNDSLLWRNLAEHHAERRIVVVSVDDLRHAEAPISRGLSWERTALDLVWQLLNVVSFEPLRTCPHLIVRLGLDGALYWQCAKGAGDGGGDYRAWLFYNPSGIEGASEDSCDGKMVAYGSVFTAALIRHLAAQSPTSVLDQGKDDADKPIPPIGIDAGIRAGLLASHRLLQMGFGKMADKPDYPGKELFLPRGDKDAFFTCQPVPIIRDADTPDRGYWRLLDSIFSGKTGLLHRAVALTAKNAKPADAEDAKAAELLAQAPIAVFAKALRTYDRHEMESYRALYSLMFDYTRQSCPPRPLSVAVFGPPGAGKSFGVKMVAKALAETGGSRPMETLTFNLSQYQSADELAAAFHLVRDVVLRGKIPLVFFDEFDTALDGKPLGWLRYFLSPMQDAEFMDRGAPHPIGQSIFVFAGGTSGSYAEFAKPFHDKDDDFKKAKGPDFLSRLRGTLDIPGLDLNPSFDAYGPTEAFPCEAAILLRRAGILAFQLGEKFPHLRDAGKALRVSPGVVRALLHLPQFEHGNRSFEALLDMSHLSGAREFTPSMLPASGHTDLHANASHLSQLIATEQPFSAQDRTKIAQAIHEHYVEQRKAKNEYKADKASHQPWEKLEPRFVASNEFQADDIPRKLRRAGLWIRKQTGVSSGNASALPLSNDQIEKLAREEHDRWVATERSKGVVYGTTSDKVPHTHKCILPWVDAVFPPEEKEKDLDAIRAIPRYLAAANYEVVKM